MIEKMLKYTMLIHHADYENILNSLYELGVVHIVTKKEIVSDDKIAAHLREINRFKGEIRFLESFLSSSGLNGKVGLEKMEDGGVLLHDIEALRENKGQLQQERAVLSNEHSRMSVWGEFEWQDIDRLSDGGYIVGFYSCLNRDFDAKWVDVYNAVCINEKAGNTYFMTVTPSHEVLELPVEKFKFGELSLRQIDEKINDINQGIVECELAIERFAVEHTGDLKNSLAYREEILTFDSVRLSTKKVAGDKIMFVDSWVPENKAKDVDALLEKMDVYCVVEEPKEEDSVPVSIKSNKFAKMFEVIGNLYDLPRYGTIDLTPWFAPFYILFFGFCFADAGYGALMVVASLAAKYIMKNKSESTKNVINLLIVLGASAILWGVLTGNVFGMELLKFDWIQASNFRNYILVPDQLFPLSLAIGVVQIVYGMIIRSVFTTINKGLKYALVHWGWTIGIGGGGIWFMLTKFGVIFDATADYTLYAILGVSGILLVFFNSPDKQIYLNPLFFIKEVYDMSTSLLGDVLSYVRLFALSISGAVMGIVFNELAMEMTGDIPVLSVIFMIIMLIIGHGMNIFMSGLSSFIHPMRLTFVEFYKNAGFEGGGKPYKPFKKKVMN